MHSTATAVPNVVVVHSPTAGPGAKGGLLAGEAKAGARGMRDVLLPGRLPPTVTLLRMSAALVMPSLVDASVTV